MRKNLLTALWMTLVTTVLFGLIYPLLVTGLAQALFPDKASGQLIQRAGATVGSRLIGQSFTGPSYFHPRPSAAGRGYEASASSGSNLASSNKTLVERVARDARRLQTENPAVPIPVDLVTASASGLDPHISPEAAEFQIPRVARERRMTEMELRALVSRYTEGRQLGFLGEPRVNVLELNLELDATHPR